MEFYLLPVEICNMCQADSRGFQTLGKRLNQRQGLWPWNKNGMTVAVVRCRKCGLIFANPQPVPKDKFINYGVNPEDYWGKQYFAADDGYFLREIHKLKK